MDKTLLFAKFEGLTKEELKKELEWRNEKLSKAMVIEDMDQNSVGLAEDSSTSCKIVAKVRKIVATTKQKRTKS